MVRYRWDETWIGVCSMMSDDETRSGSGKGNCYFFARDRCGTIDPVYEMQTDFGGVDGGEIVRRALACYTALYD